MLDAGWRSSDFQSDRTETGPSSPATYYHDGRAGPSQHTIPSAPDEATPVPASWAVAPARESRRRRALAALGGVSRPSPVSLVKSAWKNTVSRLRGRNRTPPWASPPCLTATPSRGPGERVGTPEVVHEVIRTRIRPRAGGDFRQGVWHEKTPPEPSVLAHAGSWDSGPMSGYCYAITKAPQASINAQRLSKRSVLK